MVRHNRFLQISLTALVSAFLIFSAASAAGKSKKSKKERVYRVAITNVTKDQIFSPPVLATHEAGFRVFMAGAPASAELVKVAEDGMNGPLATMLGASPEVFDVVAAGAPILPGATAYYEIHSKGKADSMSIVGMLVSTNDGFFGVNARKLSSKSRRSMSFSAVAYDAGSEGNNEDCDFIPGPCAMGSTNFRYEMGAEGYVYVHNGVHGIGMGAVNLDPSAHDWRNPVARIKVMRIH